MSYTPITNAESLPGHIPEERQRKLMSYDFELDTVTPDDIIWRLSKAVPAGFYAALRWIRDKQGDVAAKEFARNFGYEGALEMYGRFRARVGVSAGEPITTAQFAFYQDVAHTMMGVDMNHAFAGYDDEKAWVSRRRCMWGGSSPYSNAPKDLAGYCGYIDLGFAAAYRTHQPKMISKHVMTMADPVATGSIDTGVCGSVMYMTKPEGLTQRKPRDRSMPKQPGSPNTLRMTDRHGASQPLLATLPLYAAVQTAQYDRDSEIALIQDAVTLADPEVGGKIHAPEWPSVPQLFSTATEWGVTILACKGCRDARKHSGASSLAPDLVWVEANDVRLVNHTCSQVAPDGQERFTHEKQAQADESFVKLVRTDIKKAFK